MNTEPHHHYSHWSFGQTHTIIKAHPTFPIELVETTLNNKVFHYLRTTRLCYRNEVVLMDTPRVKIIVRDPFGKSPQTPAVQQEFNGLLKQELQRQPEIVQQILSITPRLSSWQLPLHDSSSAVSPAARAFDMLQANKFEFLVPDGSPVPAMRCAAIFYWGSLFNHACVPSCDIDEIAYQTRNILVFRCRQNLPKHALLSFCYGGPFSASTGFNAEAYLGRPCACPAHK